ncbi:MAG: agmatine deiminase family protein [Planctomycetota bacterium]|jgi:agmatine deiminase
MPDPSPLRFRRPTPRDEGYLWPAEWERHEATWLAWPHDEDTWGDGLEDARERMAELAAAAGEGETVHVLVADEEMEADATAHLRAAGARRCRLHRVATCDAWIRDYGPIVVAKGRGRRRARLALDFTFNAWGGKYEALQPDDGVPRRLKRIHGIPTRRPGIVLEGGSIEGNGRGTLLTTEECLLNTNRNPHLSREEIEAHLREWLGVRHVLWLGEGIVGDDTDGHVDDVARFVNPRTVVTVVEDDPRDENHAPLRDNLRRLRAQADQDGRPLQVVALPMPEPVFSDAGTQLPASYANFYVMNRAVAVPTFGSKRDARALRILRRCFPRRRVVGIDCERIVEGFGALHCLSHQLPV